MQAGSRKNIYAISEVVPDNDNRNLQQFITHSKWSACEVLDHVARDADELIGDGSDAALIIDESGFAKRKCCNFAVTPVIGWPDASPSLFEFAVCLSGANL